MSFGIAKLIEDYCADIAADLASGHDAGGMMFGSPLEALFHTGFFKALMFHPQYQYMDMHVLKDIDAERGVADLYYGSQIRVLDWPVDFVVLARSAFDEEPRLFKLAIEIDGHEFHERTKQQAARDRSRDRALQAAGYTVMRFTGSELYRDPMKCIREALNWCTARVAGIQP